MNKKILPLLITIPVALGKCVVLLVHGKTLYAGGWFVAGLWFIWIAYAFYVDKDLPMAGPYGYREGKNQAGRTFAAFGMAGLFLIVAPLG